MKFKIVSTCCYGANDVIKQYPKLMNFGFTIERKVKPVHCTIPDECGNPIEFEYDGNITYTPYIYLNDLDHLTTFIREFGQEIVITGLENDILTIEIYDGYRE